MITPWRASDGAVRKNRPLSSAVDSAGEVADADGVAHHQQQQHEQRRHHQLRRPLDAGDDAAAPWHYPYDEDFGRFIGAAMPYLYTQGVGKHAHLREFAAKPDQDPVADPSPRYAFVSPVLLRDPDDALLSLMGRLVKRRLTLLIPGVNASRLFP